MERIDYQISLIVIAQQPKYPRFYALMKMYACVNDIVRTPPFIKHQEKDTTDSMVVSKTPEYAV